MDLQELNEYINQALIEQLLQNAEDNLLHVYKTIYEKFPSEIADKNWLEFSNFVVRRRSK